MNFWLVFAVNVSSWHTSW